MIGDFFAILTSAAEYWMVLSLVGAVIYLDHKIGQLQERLHILEGTKGHVPHGHTTLMDELEAMEVYRQQAEELQAFQRRQQAHLEPMRQANGSAGGLPNTKVQP